MMEHLPGFTFNETGFISPGMPVLPSLLYLDTVVEDLAGQIFVCSYEPQDIANTIMANFISMTILFLLPSHGVLHNPSRKRVENRFVLTVSPFPLLALIIRLEVVD